MAESITPVTESTAPLGRESWRSYSTRTLMVCAALAAAFAVAFGSYTFLEAAILPVAPMVIIFTSGMWFALPLLAMLFVRKIGAGLLTAGIAGLLASFVSPYGWQLMVFAVGYALVVEVPFAVTRWRRYGAGVVWAVAIVMWAASIGMYWSLFAGTGQPAWAVGITIVLLLAAYLLWGYLALWLARALRRALHLA